MNRTQAVKTAVLAIAIAAGTAGAQRAVAQQAQADLPGMRRATRRSQFFRNRICLEERR
jgi:hypothetical protein